MGHFHVTVTDKAQLTRIVKSSEANVSASRNTLLAERATDVEWDIMGSRIAEVGLF